MSYIEAEGPGIPLSIVEKVIPADVKVWLILDSTCMAMYMVEKKISETRFGYFEAITDFSIILSVVLLTDYSIGTLLIVQFPFSIRGW